MASPLSNLFSENHFSWQAISSFAPLQPRIKRHLLQVYQTLALMVSVVALGVYCDMNRFFLRGGSFTQLASALSFLGFMSFTPTKENESTRKTLLFAFSFFQGLSLGPLVEIVGYVSSSILPQAVISTALIFGSFTLAAIYSKNQRGYLFLGGFLLSALSSMMCLSFFNIFLGSRMLFSFELYLGLLVFSLFVLYDTQLIIHRATIGSGDHLNHAADLFVDVVAIFVRILIILSKNKEEKKEEKRSSRRR